VPRSKSQIRPNHSNTVPTVSSLSNIQLLTMSNPQAFQFQQLKRKLTYRFDYLRDKGEEPPPGNVRTLLNYPTYYKKPPKRGVPPDLKPRKRRPKRWPYTEDPNPLGIGFRDTRHIARQARSRLQQRLAQYNLRLVQTLGWGGNGLACLFYLDNGNGGPRDYFVAKCCLNPHSAWIIRAERHVQRVRFLRKHCIATLLTEGRGRFIEAACMWYSSRTSIRRLLLVAVAPNHLDRAAETVEM
jgi:hypothetical protein